MRNVLCGSVVVIGLLIIVLCRGDHMVNHPELSEMQSLRHYLPWWVLSGAMILLGAFLMNKK